MHGTVLHKIDLIHDRSEFDEVWAYSYDWAAGTSNFTWILPDGFAEAPQGLYPGGHRRIAVPTQTFYNDVPIDDVQHTSLLSLLAYSYKQRFHKRQLEQRYLDGLYRQPDLPN